MKDTLLSAGAAGWFGVLTSISPCLLATNIAAISFLARRVDSPRFVLVSCACYIAGQAAAFVLVAAAIVTSLVSQPILFHVLQKYMFRLLGPILIVFALFLFELLAFRFGTGRAKEWAQSRANTGGFWVAALLGIVFAMSFCPTTAALYGSLLSLSVARGSVLVLPVIYAIGVALPVIAFSLIIAISANRLSAVFARVEHAERYARNATGTIFLAVGAYFTLAYTLRLF